MPSLNHLHIYQRVDGKPQLYRCKHPDCSHYINKKLIVGKRAMCICGANYILSHYTLTLKNPHCGNCTTKPSPNPKAKRKTIRPTDLNLDEALTTREVG